MADQESLSTTNLKVPGDPEYQQQFAQVIDPSVQVWKRFRRHPGAVVGSFIFVILLIASIFAFLSPYPSDQSEILHRLQSPSLTHWMGTDALGRDLLTRILYGGRVSLSVGLIVVGVALIIGVPIGAIAGYYGGRVDSILMRFTD